MLAPWEENYDQIRQHFIKQRHHFAKKVHIVKAMVFPVVMYRCERKLDHQGWAPKNWCFQIVVLEKMLESLLDCKEIKPVNPKENQPWVFIRRTVAEADTPIFGHLVGRADSLEKPLMLGKTEGRRRSRQQKMRWLDSITDSKQTPGGIEGQKSLVCHSPWSLKQSDTT